MNWESTSALVTITTPRPYMLLIKAFEESSYAFNGTLALLLNGIEKFLKDLRGRMLPPFNYKADPLLFHFPNQELGFYYWYSRDLLELEGQQLILHYTT